MRNYQDSDYAVNKYSPNIVYRFADGTVEVTLTDYLQSNPDKTEQDFAELKALSDEIYHKQVVDENRTGRLNVTINGLEETEQLATLSLEAELIHKADGQTAMKAAKQLLSSGKLTEIQRRRFILHYFQGVSTRKIARMEEVTHQSVCDSLQWSTKKLKKFLVE